VKLRFIDIESPSSESRVGGGAKAYRKIWCRLISPVGHVREAEAQ